MAQRSLFINGTLVYCYDDGSVEYFVRTGKGRTYLHRTFGYLKRSDGYKGVCIKCERYLVHRLIALAFLSNPDNLPEVDHINRNASDNRPCNLRWCDRKTNCNNQTRVESSLEKYGVQACKNKALYSKRYNASHARLVAVKPNGKHTMYSFDSENDERYKALKPLSQRERFYAYNSFMPTVLPALN